MTDEVETGGSQAARRRVCASCGAVVEGDRCWLCGSITISAPEERRPSAVPKGGGSRTFALSSLFLFITLVSVCFGVFVAAPGLGILLAIVAVPAVVRASASAARERAAGRPTEPGGKVRLFLSSLGILILIGLAGCTAFFAACLVACPIAMSAHDWGVLFWLTVFAGIVAATVIGFLLYRTWPRK